LASINSGMPANVKRWGPVTGLIVTLFKNLAILLEQRLVRGVRYAMVLRKPDGNTLARIGDLVDVGHLRPIIDRELPLTEIAEAHRYGETGRARGKIVIRVAPEPKEG
jgi:NADPH:quinone reductase-like Zn-dependent oxidoreductase